MMKMTQTYHFNFKGKLLIASPSSFLDKDILRNPILRIDNLTINTLGDPHLGRIFKNNIPKNKLGLREQSVKAEFINFMNPTNSPDYVIVMGDLFDKAVIKNSALLEAIEIIEQAVIKNKDVTYVILAGNHDLSKDKDIVSSFELFIKYFEKNNYSNLNIIVDVTQVTVKDINLIFYPYTPFEQEVKKITFTDKNVAFGHWEITDFSQISGVSSYKSNSIPVDILENCQIVVTGHEHKPKISNKDIFTIVTGSMQPYAFGESLDYEKFYVTEKFENVLINLKKDLNYYSNTNLRILCKHDDNLKDIVIDCLSLSYKFDKVIPTVVTTIDSTASSSSPISFSTCFLEELKDLNFSKSFETFIETLILNRTYEEEWKYD